MSDKVCITRVRVFNAERFHRRFRNRMIGAALLTVLFVCAMVYIVARFLKGAL